MSQEISADVPVLSQAAEYVTEDAAVEAGEWSEEEEGLLMDED